MWFGETYTARVESGEGWALGKLGIVIETTAGWFLTCLHGYVGSGVNNKVLWGVELSIVGRQVALCWVVIRSRFRHKWRLYVLLRLGWRYDDGVSCR